eukprot:CAMPEP_0179895444 /NCGR_PEP_ID=MMETSP0982-20121206/35829_1 /TAXON_ID=483367 /ORGANISM="non described non described, Strain CCMP 2436" /LENGTH=158 /DNA_ID=CAMNT_0021792115 /DNA_START=266 /DNA_END=738 /DNA_ORIENTATION=+
MEPHRWKLVYCHPDDGAILFPENDDVVAGRLLLQQVELKVEEHVAPVEAALAPRGRVASDQLDVPVAVREPLQLRRDEAQRLHDVAVVGGERGAHRRHAVELRVGRGPRARAPHAARRQTKREEQRRGEPHPGSGCASVWPCLRATPDRRPERSALAR